MRSLNGRLDRLEARLGGGGCACERGPASILMPGDPPPGPCPECGREPTAVEFTIRLDRGAGADEPGG
jgi:hypothetical protein